jgi:hypothetical protein
MTTACDLLDVARDEVARAGELLRRAVRSQSPTRTQLIAEGYARRRRA